MFTTIDVRNKLSIFEFTFIIIIIFNFHIFVSKEEKRAINIYAHNYHSSTNPRILLVEAAMSRNVARIFQKNPSGVAGEEGG